MGKKSFRHFTNSQNISQNVRYSSDFSMNYDVEDQGDSFFSDYYDTNHSHYDESPERTDADSNLYRDFFGIYVLKDCKLLDISDFSVLNNCCQILNNQQVHNFKELHKNDVDVDWQKFVHLVDVISSTEDIACNICLDAPMMPRILPCGHISCLLCIFELFLSNNRLNSQTNNSAMNSHSNCVVCSSEFAIKDIKLCQFRSPEQSYIDKEKNDNDFNKEPSTAFEKTKCAMGYCISSPASKFGEHLLSTHNYHKLKRLGCRSRYATLSESELIKLVEEDRDIFLQYFEHSAQNYTDSVFELAFNYFDDYIENIQHNAKCFDVEVLDDQKISTESRTEVLTYFKSLDTNETYLSNFCTRILLENEEFSKELLPDKIELTNIESISTFKGDYLLPKFFRKLFSSKPKGALVNICHSDLKNIELHDETKNKFAEKLDDLTNFLERKRTEDQSNCLGPNEPTISGQDYIGTMVSPNPSLPSDFEPLLSKDAKSGCQDTTNDIKIKEQIGKKKNYALLLKNIVK